MQSQLDLVKEGSRNDISVFKIYRKNRRGGSFWSVLKALGSKALPYINKYLVPTAKQFTRNMAGDLLGGENIKSALKRRSKQSMEDIGRRLLSGGAKKRRVKRLTTRRRGKGRSKPKLGGFKKKKRKKRKLKVKLRGGRKKNSRFRGKMKRQNKRRYMRKGLKKKVKAKCSMRMNDIFS